MWIQKTKENDKNELIDTENRQWLVEWEGVS